MIECSRMHGANGSEPRSARDVESPNFFTVNFPTLAVKVEDRCGKAGADSRMMSNSRRSVESEAVGNSLMSSTPAPSDSNSDGHASLQEHLLAEGRTAAEEALAGRFATATRALEILERQVGELKRTQEESNRILTECRGEVVTYREALASAQQAFNVQHRVARLLQDESHSNESLLCSERKRTADLSRYIACLEDQLDQVKPAASQSPPGPAPSNGPSRSTARSSNEHRQRSHPYVSLKQHSASGAPPSYPKKISTPPPLMASVDHRNSEDEQTPVVARRERERERERDRDQERDRHQHQHQQQQQHQHQHQAQMAGSPQLSPHRGRQAGYVTYHLPAHQQHHQQHHHHHQQQQQQQQQLQQQQQQQMQQHLQQHLHLQQQHQQQQQQHQQHQQHHHAHQHHDPQARSGVDMPVLQSTEQHPADGVSRTGDEVQLRLFASRFRARRLELRLTQVQVGQAIGQMGMPDFAQSTISRFEKLTLSYENALKLRPYIEKWMELSDKEALSLCSSAAAAASEAAFASGAANSPPMSAPGPPPPPTISPSGVPAAGSPAAHVPSQQLYRVYAGSPPPGVPVYAVSRPGGALPRSQPAVAVAMAGGGGGGQEHRRYGREPPPPPAYGREVAYHHELPPPPPPFFARQALLSQYGHSPLLGSVDLRTPANGMVVMPTLRRRKRRLVLPPEKRKFLEDSFDDNPRPIPEELCLMARDLELEKEEVRVWFCNRRQKQKRLANADAGGGSGSGEQYHASLTESELMAHGGPLADGPEDGSPGDLDEEEEDEGGAVGVAVHGGDGDGSYGTDDSPPAAGYYQHETRPAAPASPGAGLAGAPCPSRDVPMSAMSAMSTAHGEHGDVQVEIEVSDEDI